MMIRILLVNEVPIISNVISAAFDDETDIQVLGCPTSVDEALTHVIHHPPDLVLASIHLPDNGALRLTRTIARSYMDVKVIVLGLNEEKEQVLPYIESGAVGYILKDDSVDHMIDVIRKAYAREAVVSPRMAAAIMTRVMELARLLSEIRPVPSDFPALTAREMEVLELIEQGMSNQEIASQLFIEVGTVKNHVHNILDKLEVENRMDAAACFAVIRETRVGRGVMA